MSFFALKVVALLSMLWDHVTYVWPLALTVEVLFFPDAADTIPALLVLQRATDYIGRIAAPIFLFSIANGYVLAAGVVIAAEHFALAEGKGRYILFILAFYLTDHWPVRKKALLWLFLMPLSRYRLIWMFFSEQFTWRWFHMLCINALGPLLGVAFTFCYNGKRGPSFPGDKYLWYVFYPAHLLVLGLVNAKLQGLW